MKKKIMMVAVLLGALSLGACVDDNETQSVTDVRNAKAEQLQARADMNNAEASAQKIMADAEAALLTAKAEAQKAAAAKVNAETETIKKRTELVELQKAAAGLQNEAAKIENKRRQVELERALANLEVAKKEAEKQLAEIAARMELMAQNNQIELLKLQKRLAEAQKALVDYEKRLAAAANQAEKDKLEAEQLELKRLSNKYFQSVKALLEAQNTLTGFKSTLTGLENGLVTAKAAKEEAIANNNNTISMYEMYISKYKEYTNYKPDGDILELQNKERELEAQQSVLYDKYLDLELAFNGVKPELTAKNEAHQAVLDDAFFNWAVNKQIMVKDKDGNDKVYDINNWSLNQLTSYVPTARWNTYAKRYYCKSDNHNVSRTFGDSLVCRFVKPTEDVRRVELIINDYVSQYEGWKKESVESQKKLQANYNGKATGYYIIQHESWGEYLMEIASTTITRNAVDSTAYLKNAYEKETDATKKADYETKYKDALAVELMIKKEIGNQENTINEYSNMIKVFKSFYDLYQKYDTYEAALQKKIDARNDEDVKAYAAKVAAWKEARMANWAYEDVQIELDAIAAILDGANSMDGAEYIASQISYYEGRIAEMKKSNEDFSFVQTAEDAIKQYNLLIDAQSYIVKACEIAVANAKADLDAKMPAEE